MLLLDGGQLAAFRFAFLTELLDVATQVGQEALVGAGARLVLAGLRFAAGGRSVEQLLFGSLLFEFRALRFRKFGRTYRGGRCVRVAPQGGVTEICI